ncbi:MAG: DNA primase [Lachnospiraceae bacterium]|nr:DNA primase [Lachnospiraceae bacterium]
MSYQYSGDQIEAVRSANDIVDVIGAVVALKRSGSNYTGLCPFHNEKTPSFSVSRTKQMYYCFGCHAGGNVLTFVMEYYQYSFVEALQFLADRAGITLPKAEDTGRSKAYLDRQARLYDIQKKAAAYYHYRLKQPSGEAGLRYLRKRGLSDETIRTFGLGYAGKYSQDLYRYLKSKDFSDEDLKDAGLFTFTEKNGFTDKFWNRVMFPIQNVQGKVIGFGGRVMGDGKPKYLNSPDTDLFNKRKNLYALNIARRSREKTIILCEGYMDVISMHQAGFTNAVASLGTALTPEQAALLKRYTSDIRLLYDSDGAGVNAALRAFPILAEAGLRARVVDLKPYKDPDELIRAEGADGLRRRLASSRDAFMFELDQLARGYRLNDPQEATIFQEKTAEKLLRFADDMERENYLRAASADYHIPESALRKKVVTLALRGTPASAYNTPKPTGKTVLTREEAGALPEKMMLTYLASYPEAFAETARYIGPEDFRDPLCREIAVELYAQKETGQVREAALLNRFTDPETQKTVAGLFHTTVDVATEAEQDRAFTDTVLKLMENSLTAALDSWDGDPEALRALMTKRSEWEMMKKNRLFHLPFDKENGTGV